MYMCINKECQLFRHGKQTNKLEIPVTMLLYVENEQLLFVILDFKRYKRCND